MFSLLIADLKMGCFGSKDRLSKEDMDFLKSHTRYDETTIKEWYKGFKVTVFESSFYKAPYKKTLLSYVHFPCYMDSTRC